MIKQADHKQYYLINVGVHGNALLDI